MRSTTQAQSFPYLIIGVGLGLLAGFLWAPRAGKEMRDDLRRGADEGLNVLTKEAEKLRAGAGRWFAGIEDYFGSDKAKHRGDPSEQTSRQE